MQKYNTVMSINYQVFFQQMTFLGGIIKLSLQ